MAIEFRQDRDRNVIPNWWLYSDATKNRELSSFYLKTKSQLNILHECTIPSSPKNEECIEYLLSVIALNEFDIIDSDILKTLQSSAYPMVKYLAKSDDAKPGKKYSHHLDKRIIYSNISYLKQFIRKYPNNPIPYVDRAFYYTLVSQIDRAEDSMLVAIHLAPNSRYIIRSAIRLFIHSRNLDKLNYTLHKTDMIGYDPWVTASALSAELASKGKPSYAKTAHSLLERRAHSEHSISELSAAYAKYLFDKKKNKLAKTYLDLALKDPNSNTIAQATWMSNRIHNYKYENRSNDIENTSEARMLTHFYKSNWNEAIEYAIKWFSESPYSNRPLMYASSIAMSNLGDYKKAVDILLQGSNSHYANPDYANNLAYAYAHINDTKKAREALSKARHCDYHPDIHYFLRATYGMIDYRDNKQEDGFKKYYNVVSSAMKEGKDSIALLASLNFLREEILFSTRNHVRIENCEELNNYLNKARLRKPNDDTFNGIIKEIEDALEINITSTELSAITTNPLYNFFE